MVKSVASKPKAVTKVKAKTKAKSSSDRPASIYGLNSGRQNTSINWLVYGTPGIGKTPLAGSGDERMLILNSDGGVVSAEAMGSKAHVWDVNDYTSLLDAYEYLSNEKHSYEWVSWDGLTSFQDRALVDEILPDAHAENPRQSIDVASQREYLINHNRLTRFVRLFAALPLNFLATAHVGVAENDEGEMFYLPGLQGGKNGEIAKKVSGYFDIIGYYHLQSVKKSDGKKVKVRRMETQLTKEYLARDRYKALGSSHIDNPTVPMVEKLIAESRKADAPKKKTTKGTK